MRFALTVTGPAYGTQQASSAWQFAQADAIVLAAPLWDLSFPALLKVYIENVSVENITFGCGEAGCYGICQARRMVFLTTRGGIYEPGSEWEQGAPYLAAIQKFFGFDRFHAIAADPNTQSKLGLDEIRSMTDELFDALADVIDPRFSR